MGRLWQLTFVKVLLNYWMDYIKTWKFSLVIKLDSLRKKQQTFETEEWFVLGDPNVTGSFRIHFSVAFLETPLSFWQLSC
jgi:hypothetical protein